MPSVFFFGIKIEQSIIYKVLGRRNLRANYGRKMQNDDKINTLPLYHAIKIFSAAFYKIMFLYLILRKPSFLSLHSK